MSPWKLPEMWKTHAMAYYRYERLTPQLLGREQPTQSPPTSMAAIHDSGHG